MKQYNGEQDEYYKLGKAGCYFLCLCRVGQEYVKRRSGVEYNIDILDAFRVAKQKKYVEDNCYVANPSGVLYLVTGERWWVEKGKSKEYPKFDDRDYIDSVINIANNHGGGHFFTKYYEPLTKGFPNNEVWGYRHLYVYKKNKGAGAKTITNLTKGDISI